MTMLMSPFFWGTSALENLCMKSCCVSKYGSMVKGKISDAEAHLMFSCFQQESGTSGFEIRRRDGSAGQLSPQSDVNLLSLLPHLHSAVPRKLWSTFILRSSYAYLIFYKRCNPNKPTQSDWVPVWYSPPHNGGKIKSLPKAMIEKFPCVGEFCYQTMLASVIMSGVNTYRREHSLLPVAEEEVKNELAMLEKARHYYRKNEKHG